jgi:hypothetical protein
MYNMFLNIKASEYHNIPPLIFHYHAATSPLKSYEYMQ